MEERKRFDWKVVAILAMAVLLIICFVKIGDIEDQNQRLRNDLFVYQSEIRNLRADIAAIYSNVEELLKREASLFSGVNYAFTELNAEDKTLKLNLSLVPKLLAENMKLSVNLGDKTVELVKNGNAFEGTVEVGLFLNQVQAPLVTVETAAGKQTEFLEDVNVTHLFKRFLPVLNATMGGRSTYYSGGVLNTDMNLIIDCKSASEDIFFTSCTIVELIDGVEIGREDITVNNGVGHYTKEYKKGISLTQQQRYEVYVIAEDSLGYIHKTRAYSWVKDSFDADVQTYIGAESIYDKNGNMLYGVKYIDVMR